MTQEQLHSLKVGDTVVRMLGAGGPTMELKVTSLIGNVIGCGPWMFHRDTGGEIDEDIGWDGVTDTGSYLVELLK